jgi:hypothetical protein
MRAAPQLHLLTVKRAEAADYDKRARNGDAEAERWFMSLWNHIEEPLACFLCSRETARPPYCAVIPEILGGERNMIAAPLCAVCQSLDQRVRFSRCLRVLKRMYQRRTGRRGLAFHFINNRR